MNSAFPHANINGYDKMINRLSLPDIHDRHILAAAISAKADVIVTFNLKDFPSVYLKSFMLKAIHPHEFINDLIKI